MNSPLPTVLTFLLAALSLLGCKDGSSDGVFDPDDDPPLPEIVIDFPGAQVDGRTITIFEGDDLRCDFELNPPSATLALSIQYDNRNANCAANHGPVGTLKKISWAVGGVIFPTLGTHTLDWRLITGADTILATVTYTLVVLPRPSGSVGQRIP